MTMVVVLLFGLFLVTFVMMALAFFFLGRLWLKTFMNGVPVPLIRILAMRLRGNPAGLLIDAFITLRQSNVTTSIDELETTYIQSANRIRSSYDLVEMIKTKQKTESAERR